MKQLDNKESSSPWEVKKGDIASPATAQWTEVKEQIQEKTEKKEEEKKKKTHFTYFIELNPFGYHVIQGCPLDKSPPRDYFFPMPSRMTARRYSPSEAPDRGLVFYFERGHVGNDCVYYNFAGVR